MNLFARFWNWIKRMFMVNHLSGFGGGTSPITFTLVGITGSVTSSATPHASAAAGDLAIYGSHGTNGASGAITDASISGWTKLGTVFGPSGSPQNTHRGTYFAKVLVSGDLGTPVTGVAGATFSMSSMFVFRPNRTISTISVPTAFTGDTKDTTTQTATLTADPTAYVSSGSVFVCGMAATWNATASFGAATSPSFTWTDSQDSTAETTCGISYYSTAPVSHAIQARPGSGGGGSSLVLAGMLLIQ